MAHVYRIVICMLYSYQVAHQQQMHIRKVMKICGHRNMHLLEISLLGPIIDLDGIIHEKNMAYLIGRVESYFHFNLNFFATRPEIFYGMRMITGFRPRIAIGEMQI